MAGFEILIRNLRRAEKEFEGKLAGIRGAIQSLKTGSASAAASIGKRQSRKRVRKMSAATRAKMRAAAKKRWAMKKASSK